MLAVTLLLGCAGAGADPQPEDRPEAEGAGCTDRWEDLGQPLLLTWCAPCHSSQLAEGLRYAAPVGVDLETLAGVHTWGERVAARVADGTMPPGGGVPEADSARLLAWLECGAPGEEAPLAVSGAASLDYTALALDERAAASDVEGATLAVHSAPQTWGGLDWSVEHWQQDDTQAALLARDRFDADGVLIFTDTWDPPLRLWDGSEDSWTVHTTRVRVGEGAGAAEEVWTVEVSREVLADPRLLADSGDQVEAWTEDGDGVGLLVHPTLGYIQRWHVGGRFVDPEATRADLANSGGGEVAAGSGVPFWQEGGWGARLILSGG